MWQALETKARFIAQVMTGDKGLVRRIEDVDGAALTYAEVKAIASGNPMVIEKAGVDADVARYSSLFMVWRNQRYADESEVAHLPMRIQSSAKLLRALTSDADTAASLLKAGDLVATVHGRTHRGPESLGDALRTVIRMARASVSARSTEELLGAVGTFDLYVFIGREFDDVHLYLKGEAIHDCRSCQTGPALYQALRDTILAMSDRRVDRAQARVDTSPAGRTARRTGQAVRIRGTVDRPPGQAARTGCGARPRQRRGRNPKRSWKQLKNPWQPEPALSAPSHPRWGRFVRSAPTHVKNPRLPVWRKVYVGWQGREGEPSQDHLAESFKWRL